MKLVALNPRFIDHGGEGVTRAGIPVPRSEGIGVMFDCPCGCGRPIYVPFSNPIKAVGDLWVGNQAHWQRTGETFDTMTLTPSIRRLDGCAWHGFVTNGEIVNA
jgi:hypothetical protein